MSKFARILRVLYGALVHVCATLRAFPIRCECIKISGPPVDDQPPVIKYARLPTVLSVLICRTMIVAQPMWYSLCHKRLGCPRSARTTTAAGFIGTSSFTCSVCRQSAVCICDDHDVWDPPLHHLAGKTVRPTGCVDSHLIHESRQIPLMPRSIQPLYDRTAYRILVCLYRVAGHGGTDRQGARGHSAAADPQGRLHGRTVLEYMYYSRSRSMGLSNLASTIGYKTYHRPTIGRRGVCGPSPQTSTSRSRERRGKPRSLANTVAFRAGCPEVAI